MKAVIPPADSGTRLYPQTHTKPEMIVRIAGKPILDQIPPSPVGPSIDEAVLIVARPPLQTQICEYVKREFGGESTFWFPEQANPEKFGHQSPKQLLSLTASRKRSTLVTTAS